MQVIRKASFTAIPWKNGGGITHEAIRVPATGEAFRWRLSVAHIDESGPFSDFAGYDRKMVLLRGAGVSLTFDAADSANLVQIGDMAEFDGALQATCRLLDGPCTDLNLMVSKSLRGVACAVERLHGSRVIRPAGHEITLVFGIEGCLLVECEGGDPVGLQPWDLAILPAEGVVRPVDQKPSPLVFFATLEDNSP